MTDNLTIRAPMNDEWPDTRSRLPDVGPAGSEDNPIVWCPRERRFHAYYTMTKRDFEQIITDKVDDLRREIDRRAMEAVYRQIGGSL